MHMTLKSFSLLTAVAILSACTPTDVREGLGITKESPDEFAVVKRAPLEVNDAILSGNAPLPKPNLGAQRPQETTPKLFARQTLIGFDEKPPQAPTKASSSDALFLQKLGADQADTNIRATIDQEAEELRNRNKPVAERLFNWGGDRDIPSATVLNAEEEAKRIRLNKEQGKSITEGETPSIEE